LCSCHYFLYFELLYLCDPYINKCDYKDYLLVCCFQAQIGSRSNELTAQSKGKPKRRSPFDSDGSQSHAPGGRRRQFSAGQAAGQPRYPTGFSRGWAWTPSTSIAVRDLEADTHGTTAQIARSLCLMSAIGPTYLSNPIIHAFDRSAKPYPPHSCFRKFRPLHANANLLTQCERLARSVLNRRRRARLLTGRALCF
jgi:hypothetical protein